VVALPTAPIGGKKAMVQAGEEGEHGPHSDGQLEHVSEASQKPFPQVGAHGPHSDGQLEHVSEASQKPFPQDAPVQVVYWCVTCAGRVS